jgi:hypothetical protein
MTEHINHHKRNAKLVATRRTTNQAYRIEENERNAASMTTVRDPRKSESTMVP